MTSTPGPRLAVFYDGTCPLCRREIAFYRRLRGADTVDWVDASGEPADGLSCEAALARFHVRQPGGTLLSGAAAFAALWRALPATRWLGLALGAPPVVWIAEALYRVALPLRAPIARLLFPKEPVSRPAR